MSNFDLDLNAVEDHLPDEADEEDLSGAVELGHLDGSTSDEEWVETVMSGRILVLNVEGDVNELAAGFAREIRNEGGGLVHFRGFLIVSPPGIEIDTDRV
ncbi:DUF5779 family protein [Haloarchaeobius iranensis]|uniref:Cell division protein SepF n=1 Tax=Haloarchaeobius iranensis TaxID=996166 RepID=A0A1G9UN66_9EURY|nr:DUF5779 family protein [Haloarchaeobius iranensis]SDM61358.1 hypothetical protein SAMN05192554_104225 [Haloarchaeobius iranensis]